MQVTKRKEGGRGKRLLRFSFLWCFKLKFGGDFDSSHFFFVSRHAVGLMFHFKSPVVWLILLVNLSNSCKENLPLEPRGLLPDTVSGRHRDF